MKFQKIFSILFIKHLVVYSLVLYVIDAFLAGGIVITTMTVATTLMKTTANLDPAPNLSSSK